MGSYLTWAENHAAGMKAAEAKTASRRLSGAALAERRRVTRERYPCKVKGCKRTAYKGAICKAHWETIPQREKIELVGALYDAQRKITDKFHRRFLRELNAAPGGR